MFVSLQFKLELKREDKQKLIKLMRKQSSAIRTAYNMLRELEKEKTRNPHAQIYQRLRKLFPRITTGNREFIYVKVLREPSNSKDKWLTFMAMLLESWQTKNYFAYTVELKLREVEVYGSVSFEIPTPEAKYTKEKGVIAIDTNASPIHLAVAEGRCQLLAFIGWAG